MGADFRLRLTVHARADDRGRPPAEVHVTGLVLQVLELGITHWCAAMIERTLSFKLSEYPGHRIAPTNRLLC
jgi:hypothetical protein